MGRNMATIPPRGETKRLRRNPITWFLVADGTRARTYVRKRVKVRIPMKHQHYEERVEKDLAAVPGMAWEAESPSEYEFSNDTRGRIFESAVPMRHAAEPHVDIREDLKLRFMGTLADKLLAAEQRKSFDRLVLIAPPKLLGELKKQLDQRVLSRVVAELPKEMTVYSGRELAGRLEGIL